MDTNTGPLNVREIGDSEHRVVFLEGELDMWARVHLAATLRGAGNMPTDMDLSALTFMDCGGYRALGLASADGAGVVRLRHARGQPLALLGLLDELQLSHPGIRLE